MELKELYERYVQVYEIEIRETSSPLGRKLLAEINMLEDLTLEEFEESLKEDEKFRKKWGNEQIF
jgi:hypothetical protein